MHLYLLEWTPLKYIKDISPCPTKGDVIVIFRAGQDPEVQEKEKLNTDGITIIFGERLLNRDESDKINCFGTQFIDTWHYDNNQDVSLVHGYSLGEFISPQILTKSLPWYLVRTGEIVRRVINDNSKAHHIYCDFINGINIESARDNFIPLKDITRKITHDAGKQFHSIQPLKPLPSVKAKTLLPNHSPWTSMIKALFGGLRPAYIFSRFKIRWHKWLKKNSTDIYVFSGRGMGSLIEKLLNEGYKITTDQPSDNNTLTIRHDHLIAFPTWMEIRTTWRLYNHAREMSSNSDRLSTWTFNGIDYSRFLAKSVTQIFLDTLPISIVKIAQVRKMQSLLNCRAVIVNGETGAGPRSLVYLNRNTDMQIYYVCHAMGIHKFQPFCMGRNHSHVTYFPCGSDHLSQYGARLPDNKKPRMLVTGSPAANIFKNIQIKRSAINQKRIMFQNFSPAGFVIAARIRKIDDYTIHIFKVARILLDEGWKVTFRGHPQIGNELEYKMATNMNMEKLIDWGDHLAFDQALLNHDIVVCSTSTSFYQTLYAQWPAIFYEPLRQNEYGSDGIGYDNFFVGLPAATDIKRPFVKNQQDLLKFIRQSLDPDSFISKFPKKFTTEFAHRFIGPNPDGSETNIVRFIKYNTPPSQSIVSE